MSAEREPKFETGKNAELDSRQIEKIREQAENKIEKEAAAAEARAEKENSLEVINERLEKARANKEPVTVDHQSETRASESPVTASQTFTANSVKQTTRRMQKKLSKPQKAFSKVIHQPVVEALSDVGEKTIARPSGLLVGGLFSVLSSLVILYICRHYGYEYNFLVGLLGLAGGFVLGVLLEGIFKVFKHS